jgi:hypothetical protein
MTFDKDNASRMRRRVAILGLAVLLAVNGVLLVVQPGLALPRSLAAYFFGPKLVRADVVVRDGGIRQYRLDQGRLLRVQGSSLLVREGDGSVVVVPVAPEATIRLNGRPVTLQSLRRGLRVLTIREGGAAASEVRAVSR